MAPLQVQIKHAGKAYDVQLDPDLPPVVFKEAIYQVTGVPVDRMKVMVKSGILKDDTPWKKINPKQGQSFMVVGAAGELPKPPEKPTVFLEDMDDEELAEALAKPVGLRNLGNTCYMNSTVQLLRTIPELQIALSIPALQSDTPLPAALRDLYHTMSRTTDSVTPKGFLDVLRQVNPQFAERDRSAKGVPGALLGYAQQDAEECYGQLITTLRNVPGISPNGPGSQDGKKFIDQYLMGEIRRELTCDDAPDEPASVTVEQVLKLECNITITTNYLASGLQNAMDQKVEKQSPTLGRQAVYSQKSRITRLPNYLTIHMARFSWRQDIMKKAKIMRKVKFPLELDALDLASEELKTRLLPVSRRLKEIEKERGERRKIRKRTKVAVPSGANSAAPAAASSGSATGSGEAATPATAGGDVEMQDGSATAVPSAAAGGELEDEHVYRARELAELEALVNEDVKKDTGASVSGLYELVAIITHKGAAADAGHYMAFAKKSAFHPRKGALPAAAGTAGVETSTSKVEIEDDDDDWYKFDDEKVSIFPEEKLATLDGGGEDSSAYVLLYKSRSLA